MYNRVIFMGRITAEPEMKQTNGGMSVTRFTIAVDKYKREDGADFFNITAFGKTGEFVAKYFGKGQVIHVEGKLQNNNYEDSNGVKHYGYTIIADNVAFCGGKSDGQSQNQNDDGVGDLTDFEPILESEVVPF